MTYVSPAGLGLYFFIGGIFACIQTLIINFMRPRIRQEMQNELKNKPVVEVELPSKTEEETTNTSESKTNAELIHQNNRKRNAGKQKNR